MAQRFIAIFWFFLLSRSPCHSLGQVSIPSPRDQGQIYVHPVNAALLTWVMTLKCFLAWTSFLPNHFRGSQVISPVRLTLCSRAQVDFELVEVVPMLHGCDWKATYEISYFEMSVICKSPVKPGFLKKQEIFLNQELQIGSYWSFKMDGLKMNYVAKNKSFSSLFCIYLFNINIVNPVWENVMILLKDISNGITILKLFMSSNTKLSEIGLEFKEKMWF